MFRCPSENFAYYKWPEETIVLISTTSPKPIIVNGETITTTPIPTITFVPDPIIVITESLKDIQFEDDIFVPQNQSEATTKAMSPPKKATKKPTIPVEYILLIVICVTVVLVAIGLSAYCICFGNCFEIVILIVFY